MESALHITPFSIQIEAEILSDLRERIRKTRWPDQAPGAAWEQGTDLDYLRQLLTYWADEFDWQAQERELNAATQFRAELAGLAAWILEKWRSWADSRGNLDERISRDFLLTTVTLYWVTQTITSSMRDYFDNDNRRFRIALGPKEFVDVPTGIAVFANNFVEEGTPPREWAERLYNVRRWTPMPRGGHFAPAEEPELLARDIAAFFAGL